MICLIDNKKNIYIHIMAIEDEYPAFIERYISKRKLNLRSIINDLYLIAKLEDYEISNISTIVKSWPKE